MMDSSLLFANSDQILCNNYASVVYEHKKQNDDVFLNIITQPRQYCARAIDRESSFNISESSRQKKCTDDIKTRGNNATCFEKPKIQVGYDAFPNKVQNDYLLVPCPRNTFQNYVVQNKEKGCSVHHQLFNNMTRRV